MFQLIAINFSQKSPTSPCELPEREVTSLSNLKVVGALQYINIKDNTIYSHHKIATILLTVKDKS